MPDENYHIEKRDRFRNAAEYLITSKRVFSYDPTVQDCFYSAMHEAERFLARLGKHSRSHGQRENYVSNYMIEVGGAIVDRTQFNRNRRYPSDRLFDRDAEFCYMELVKLRLDLVYGKEILGRLRHANQRDTQRASHLLIRFSNALVRHENDLRRRGIV